MMGLNSTNLFKFDTQIRLKGGGYLEKKNFIIIINITVRVRTSRGGVISGESAPCSHVVEPTSVRLDIM